MSYLSKKDLAERVYSVTEIYSRQAVEGIIDALFYVMADAIRHREEIRIRGFGTFSGSTRAAFECKNPTTGKIMQVEERYIPRFTISSKLSREAGSTDSNPSDK